MSGSDAVTVARVGLESLDDLQPLWESLAAHHVRVAPYLRDIGPPRDPAGSWALRRARYAELLAGADGFAMTAVAGGRPVGYALVRVRGPQESWDTGAVAELETLAVLPGYRGQGIGSMLVEAVFAELRGRRVPNMSVAASATNEGAIRFYERLGLLPFTRSFIGRVPGA